MFNDNSKELLRLRSSSFVNMSRELNTVMCIGTSDVIYN